MNANQCRQRLSELLQAQIGCIASANEYLLTIKSAIAENRMENL